MLSADYPPFRPSRLMRSAHAQTVGAFFVGGKPLPYNASKHVVHLHDDDRVVLHDDKPDSWITGDRIAILFHGLCGSHLSPCVARAADKLSRRGIRTFRLDMRGFGDSTYISKSHLHGGNYQDANSVIEFVHRLSPLSKISLVGFSIGGNIVLKTLGVWGDSPHPQVDSAIAISPPVDLVHSSWNLRQGANRLYELSFVRSLHAQLRERRKKVKGLVDNNMNPLPTRLIHWDDQFTAPCWGYSGAMDYYEDASSAEQLYRVNVPTIILTAQDDPIVPFAMYSEYEMSEQIELIATKQGGHLGYLSHGAKDPDRFWMDWRICQWIASMDEEVEPAVTRREPAQSRNPVPLGRWR